MARGEGDFETFYTAHVSGMVRSLLAAHGDAEAVNEAVQDAFQQAYVRWWRISHYDNPVAWVRRVAINRLVDHHRRQKRHQRTLQSLAQERPVEPLPIELSDGLADAVSSLAPRQRMAVILYYVDDLSVEEVAAAMAVSTGSVKRHLSDARLRLRERLQLSVEGTP